jgi:hypothetical protein
MNKRVLIILIIALLIIAIPGTIFFLKTQTQTQSKATPATTLAFSTLSQPATTGNTFDLDVNMNPGTNQVDFVTLTIAYDGSKVKKGGNGIVVNTTAFPTTLEGPIYDQCSGTSCTMSITVSVGADPTKVITTPTKVATVTFQALASTAGATTQISFGSTTKVLSIGPSDQPSENVLSSTSPANVTIADAGGTTPTTAATPTTGTTPTIAATATLSPTTPPGSTASPTVAATASPTTAAATSTPTTASGATATTAPTSANATATDTTAPTAIAANGSVTPTPNLVTGPAQTLMGIGAIGLLLAIGGIFLIFGL